MITKFESPLRFRIALAALALLACFAASARADVSVPAVLGDGMVMQRQTDAPLWGWASPGETVRVFADWGPGGETVSAETTADADGRWMLHLATPDAGGPYTLKIQANNTVEISDVMVGEVWLCSGQSNMEWPLARAQNPDAEIAAANHPHIRLFTVPNVFALHPRSDCDGAWTACTPDSARTFSAVGYFFGRRLHEELGVPIGLISADWGGTVAEAWMSPAALARFPQFESALAFIEAARDPVRRTSVGEEGKQRWWRALDRRAPDRPQGRWTATDYDASAWKTMRLPATLAGDGLDAFDGLVYFRRKVDLPPAWAGKA
ncbi:MAG: sialate O-acetylesterase family protein, partial [Planctomycetota bacterium]